MTYDYIMYGGRVFEFDHMPTFDELTATIESAGYHIGDIAYMPDSDDPEILGKPGSERAACCRTNV
jgi:hypothetical protein